MDDYHLVVYVKIGETNSDTDLLQRLVELFQDKEIKKWVELRRQIKEVKVRFLADHDAEANHDFNVDGVQVDAFAKPGTSICLQRSRELETEFIPRETITTLHVKDTVISKKGTLTTFCHVKDSVPKKSYAMTCFHVGYNGQYTLELDTTTSSLQTLNENFENLRSEARSPSHQQRNTAYLYENVPPPLPLGNYAKALFDESHDILLISPQGSDVHFQCPVDHGLAYTKAEWKRRQRNKRKGKKNITQAAVVKIGPSNELVEVEIMDRTTLYDIPFENAYLISPTVSTQPFLMKGDSGSLVYIKDINNNHKPFAYGVCEADPGLFSSDSYLSVCLDLKKSVFKLAETLDEDLVLCHRDCN